MKAAVCFLLFVTFALAQFDQTIETGTSVTLTRFNDLEFSEDYSGSVEGEQLILNGCRSKSHQIRSVQTNNGPNNVATFLKFEFVNDGPADVEWQFVTDLDGASSFQQDTCNSGNVCLYEYPCDPVPNESTFFVLLNSVLDFDTSANYTMYNFTVTQHVDEVQTISSSRTRDQSNSVDDVVYDSDHIGPENFVHYYHELELTEQEQVDGADLFVLVNDFNNVTGDVVVCVSFTTLVYDNSDSGYDTSVFEADGVTPTDQSTPSARNNPCSESFCSDFTLTEGVGGAFVNFDVCDTCPGDMFIGVRSPVGSTYTVSIGSNAPTTEEFSIVQLGSSGKFNGAISTDSCDPDDHDFSCEAHYSLSLPQFTNDNQYASIIITGVINGDIEATLTTNLGGNAECGCSPSSSIGTCSSPFETCSINVGCDVASMVDGEEIFLNVVVTSINDSDFPVLFTVEFISAEHPVETLGTDTNSPISGEIKIGEYHHYVINFDSDDINRDTQFTMELFPQEPNEDELAFAWNYGDFAGIDCYENMGYCVTTTGCSTQTTPYFGTYDNYCRFAFNPCSYELGVDESNAGATLTAGVSNWNGAGNGLKVASLESGTYYFSVFIPETTSLHYDTSVLYTVIPTLRRSMPLYDSAVVHGSVFYGEFSNQYQIALPNDPTYNSVDISIGNLQNGDVDFFVSCGSFAGPCPCFENIDFTCSLQSGAPANHTCDLHISRCDCDGDSLYLSAFQVAPGSINPKQPATFTMNALYHTYLENSQITPISVERTEVVSVNGFLTSNIYAPVIFYQAEQRSGFNRDHYRLDFENVEFSPYLSLSVSVSVSEELSSYYPAQNVLLSIGENTPLDLFPNSQFVSLNRVGDYRSCSGLYCKADFSPYFNYNYINFKRDNVDVEEKQQHKRKLNQFGPQSYFRGYNSYAPEGRYSKCQLEVHQCSEKQYCGGNVDLLRLNFDSSYIVSVTSDTLPFFGFGSGVRYTLNVKLVDNTPTVLTDSVPLTNTLDFGYKHYTFSDSSIPSNSRISFRMYKKSNVDTQVLNFFFNYENSNEVSADSLAGDTTECKDNFFCSYCKLDNMGPNDCFYDFQPCDVSKNTGTYYVSVRMGQTITVYDNYGLDSVNNYYYGISGVYYSSDLLTKVGARKNTFDEAQFTVSVDVFPMEEIIVGDVSSLTGSLRVGEMKHYHFSIPNDVSGTAGKLTTLTLYSPDAGVFYSIDSVQPDDLCHSPDDMNSLAQDSPFRWSVTPCDETTTDYYVTVASQNRNYLDDYYNLYGNPDCGEVSFAINVDFVDVVEVSISASNINDGNIKSFYNSTAQFDDDDQNALALSRDEIVVYRFDPNFSEDGNEFMVIDIFQMDGTGEQFDVYLSVGAPVFTDSNTPANCPFIDSFTGVSNPSEGDVRFIIDDCAEGSDQVYYITFVGSGVGANVDTGIITTHIRVFQSVRVISVPNSNNLVAETNVTYANPSDVERYLFHTTTNLDLDGGDHLIFTATNVETFEVRRGDSAQCGITCSDNGSGTGTRTCSVFACDDINSATWYFHIETDTLSDEMITIELVENPITSSLSLNTLPMNTQRNFTALNGNDGDVDVEFRYHTFTVPGSSDSKFELTTIGIDDSDIYYVTERTYFPTYVPQSEEVLLSSDGSATGTCTATTVLGSLPSSTCCNVETEYTFAVIGGSTNYTLEVVVTDLIADDRNVNLPTTQTLTVPVDMVSFVTANIPNGNSIFFSFSVQNGSARIYSNVGDSAGADNSDPAGGCYLNDGIVDSICNSFMDNTDEACSGYISSCSYCVADSGNTQYTFGIVSDGSEEAIVTLSIEDAIALDTVNTGSNNNLRFPFSDDIDDSSNSGDDFPTFVKLQYTYDGNDERNFPPLSDDPSFVDPDLYPRVRFTFSNFERSNGSVIANPFDIFISNTETFGSSDCFQGDQIDSSRSTLPCLENGSGAAIFNDTHVICTINTCDIGCGGDVFFSLARANNEDLQYRYSLDIEELFDDLDDFYRIDTFNVDGASNTFSFSQGSNTDEVEVVYVRTTYNIDAMQYPIFSVEVTQNETTVIDVDMFGTLTSCQSYSTVTNMCSGIQIGDSCTWTWDPCTSVDQDGAVVYFRFARTGGIGEWGFTLDAPLITPPIVDQSQTQLSYSSPPTTVSPSQSYMSDSYSAKKLIDQNSWQFYKFSIDENNGYSWFNLDVSNFNCDTSGSDITVYYSLDTDGFTDVVKPNRVPTEDCNIISVPNGGSPGSAVMDTCQFVAGDYWVGIFADEDTRIFPDPIEDDDEFLITYDVSATLMTYHWDDIVCGEMIDLFNIDVNGDYSVAGIARRVYTLPERNINSRVTVTMTNIMDSTDSSSTLWWSTELPSGTPGGVCESNQVQCDFSAGSCTFSVDPLMNNDGKIFLFLDTAEVSMFQFTVEHDDTYIPVWDLRNGPIDETLMIGNTKKTVKIITGDLPFDTIFTGLQDSCSIGGLIEVNYTTSLMGAVSGNYEVADCDHCDCAVGMIEGSCNFLTFGGENIDCLQDVCGSSYFVNLYSTTPQQSYPVRIQIFEPTVQQVSLDTPISAEYQCKDTVSNQFRYFYELPEVDFTKAISLSLEVDNDLVDSLNIWYLSELSETCTRTPFDNDESCLIGECVFDFDGCLMDYPKYIMVVANVICNQCSDYSNQRLISSELSNDAIFTLEIVTSTPDENLIPVTFNQDTVLSTTDEPYILPFPTRDIAGCAPECTNFAAAGSTYFFTSTPTTTNFAPTSLSTTSSRSVSIDGGDVFEQTYTVDLSNMDFFDTLEITLENFESDDKKLDVASLDFHIDVSFDTEPVAPNACAACTDGDVFAGIAPIGCGSTNLAYTATPLSSCGVSTAYVKISLCASSPCDFNFDVSATIVNSMDSLTSVSGGQHTADFNTFADISSTSVGCSAPLPANPTQFLVPSGPIAHVNIKGAVGPVSATLQDNCGPSSLVCNTIGANDDCTCDTSYDNHCAYDNCQSGGDFVLALTGTQFEYQVVTDYTPLTSTRSNVELYSRNAHFYSIADADSSSLVLRVNVQRGPAVKIVMTPTCGTEENFMEVRKCVYGECIISIPTWAKNPGFGSLAVAIFGEDNESNLNVGDFEKMIVYDISVTRGTANCAPFPNTGFCSNIPVTNNLVWNEDFEATNARAQCTAFDSLFTCATPTEECSELLRQWSCLQAFPQCDSNGYQMGICSDLCSRVESTCGLSNVCVNTCLAPGSGGTCVTLPDVPTPPTTVQDPSEIFADDDGQETPEVPVDGEPILLTIPAQGPIYIDTTNQKMVRKVDGSSSSSTLSCISFLVLLLVILF